MPPHLPGLSTGMHEPRVSYPGSSFHDFIKIQTGIYEKWKKNFDVQQNYGGSLPLNYCKPTLKPRYCCNLDIHL